jgi:hypothetical protein
MSRIAASTIAGCFALAAFAVAVVAGLTAGNAAGSILVRAIIAMIACYPIGLGVGLVAQWVIDQQIATHKEANPAPEVPIDAPRAARSTDEGDEDVLVV